MAYSPHPNPMLSELPLVKKLFSPVHLKIFFNFLAIKNRYRIHLINTVEILL